MSENQGMLYLVATPIGNLEDITFRAIRILKEVDLIACEDTRHTIKLLNHYEIKKPLISYYEHNKITKGNLLIEKLMAGENIALVSDAGTPGISDPGEDLVKLCVENNISVTMCPGAVACVMGLVISGLSTGRFVFEGFLPMNKKSRKQHLDLLENEERTIILYEAPHKLKYSLSDLYKTLGDRKMVLARELTKKFEEVSKGQISDFIRKYEDKTPKGEYVVIIEGKESSFLDKSINWEISTYDHVKEFIEKGLERKEAIKKVAEVRGLRKAEVYNKYEQDKRDEK